MELEHQLIFLRPVPYYHWRWKVCLSYKLANRFLSWGPKWVLKWNALSPPSALEPAHKRQLRKQLTQKRWFCSLVFLLSAISLLPPASFHPSLIPPSLPPLFFGVSPFFLSFPPFLLSSFLSSISFFFFLFSFNCHKCNAVVFLGSCW